MASSQINKFSKRILVSAILMHSGQTLAANSFDVVSDYYANQVFDDLSYDRFVELMTKAENGQTLAREYASAVVSEGDFTQDINLLRHSNAQLIERARSIVASNPEKLFVIHKELKEGDYPEPLAIEALYQIHKAYDEKYQAFADAHTADGSEVAIIDQASDDTISQSLDSQNTAVSYDQFTWFSAPAESITLNNTVSLEREPSLSEVKFDPLDALALMPVETCDYVEPIVEAVKEEPVDNKFFAGDVAIKPVDSNDLLLPLSLSGSIKHIARKDDDYLLDDLARVDNMPYQTLNAQVFIKPEEHSVKATHQSSLWLIDLHYA